MFKDLQPPVAKKIPHEMTLHGDTRVDNYYWLNERTHLDVIDYLKAENAYLTHEMEATEALQQTVYDEIVARIKKDDASVPYKFKDYYYYVRYEEGQEYPYHCRKKNSLDAREEIILDEPTLAVGESYFNVGSAKVSFGQDILAYAVDVQGRRIYTIYFKDLETGQLLDDRLERVTSNMVWANDNKTFFYAKQDPETLRSSQIYRHVLGTSQGDDLLVYEETDETFDCSISKSKSQNYLYIYSDSTLSTEQRYLKADDPEGFFKIIQPREAEHEYSAEDYQDKFYILTNADGAKNFKVAVTSIHRSERTYWKNYIAHRDDVLLDGFDVFNDFLVLDERKDGLTKLRVKRWDGTDDYTIDVDEPAYVLGFGANIEMESSVLRYVYASLTTPSSTYDYDMKTHEKTLLKRKDVLGDYDSGNYRTERLTALAEDGAKIPISLVYRKGLKKDGTHPLLVYGYGSYGHSLDPGFQIALPSLLDRGFVFAIAHIRGGQEMGRQWYEDGRQLNKKNTFTDFIAVTKYLIDQGYSSADKTFAQGGSAGGLLMGVVANMAPELYQGIIADVPFVDVVTTMLDETVPLTTGEYDEWGNPTVKEHYEYMLSYSPYDHVEAKDYPHMLVLTGLNDSQVQYWEPAKWVAKLRDLKTDDHLLLLKTDMDVGHGGASGRFASYKDVALKYSFLLKILGMKE